MPTLKCTCFAKVALQITSICVEVVKASNTKTGSKSVSNATRFYFLFMVSCSRFSDPNDYTIMANHRASGFMQNAGT